MKNFTLLIAILFANVILAKSYEPAKEVYLSDESKVPNYIEFDLEDAPFFSELNVIMGTYLKDENLGFTLLKSEKDELGFTHHRFQQTYNGNPIELGELKVHEFNGKIKSINSVLTNSKPSSTEASLTEEAALQIALGLIDADTYKWEVEIEEKHLKEINNDPLATYYPDGELVYLSADLGVKAENLRLAYRFNVYAHNPLSRNDIYVDAASGDVLFVNNLIHTANVPGTAVTAYSGTQTINVDSLGPNQFRLRQTVSGNGINTYDMNGGNNYGAAADFTDTDNFWNNTNAQQDEYATDAHWGAEKTHDYFLTEHSRNSINNAGFALNSYIHYLPPNANTYVNAFWDGQRMTYGDGAGNITPLVALDIAGHEITHGLTTFSANLVYASESGALNESFSDIFGTAIEFYARPGNANWTVGEDINLILRSMSNPGLYGDPDTRTGNNWTNVNGCVPSNANDQCGVHSNSGVQNFWFYLLTQGGTGTNDLSNAYNVTGLGIQKASKIAFRNLTVYLNRTSDYDDARFFAIQSAIDLYGACSPEVQSVTNAWHAVGVGNSYVAGVQSDFIASATTSCQPPFTVFFENNSNNGSSFFWDFGDGNTSTQRNPVNTYSAFGNFDVKLVADGGSCGIDSITKLGHIDIDTANPCVVILANGVNATQLECNGKLFDSGGSTGDYAPNQTSTITISPVNAATVTLNIISFDVEAGTNSSSCNWDYLEIFDGASTASPSLGQFCNNSATQLPNSITSTNGDITLRFVSDGALEEAGFEIDWNCNFPTSAPSADFTNSQDSSCSGVIEFSDISTNAASSWLWDFGDGNFSIQENPIHTYTANGTFNVKLVSSNNFGSDSITKTNLITINRPAAPVAATDTICINNSTTLTATGQGTIRWYTDEIGGSLLVSGNSYNTSVLDRDTSFWVEDFIPQPTVSGGPSSNTFGNGGFFNQDRRQIFDVFKTITLTDVFVYSNTTGIRVFQLRDASGTVIQTHTQFLSTGLQNVDLDFLIEPGQDYQLGVDDSNGRLVDLYRNNSGVSYPYQISNLVTIKSSTAQNNPQNFFYFFYFWRVKEVDCTSPRSESRVKIDSTCTITSINEINSEEGELTIFPNPVADEFNVIVPESSENYSISLLDLNGRLVKNVKLNSSNRMVVNTQGLSNGIYFVQFNSAKTSTVKRIVINK